MKLNVNILSLHTQKSREYLFYDISAKNYEFLVELNKVSINLSIYLTAELLLYTGQAAESKQLKNAKNEDNCGERAQLSVRYAEHGVLNISGIQM